MKNFDVKNASKIAYGVGYRNPIHFTILLRDASPCNSLVAGHAATTVDTYI